MIPYSFSFSRSKKRFGVKQRYAKPLFFLNAKNPQVVFLTGFSKHDLSFLISTDSTDYVLF